MTQVLDDLVALAERHLETMTAEARRQVERTQAAEQPLGEWLRELAAGLLAVHEAEPELHVVFAEAPHRPALHACILQAEETLAHAIEPQLRASPEVGVPDCDTAAHLVVQTVEALTHRFVHHGIHDLSRERFVDEVVRLLCGYLRGAEG